MSEHQHDHPDVYCPRCVEFGSSELRSAVEALLVEWESDVERAGRRSVYAKAMQVACAHELRAVLAGSHGRRPA